MTAASASCHLTNSSMNIILHFCHIRCHRMHFWQQDTACTGDCQSLCPAAAVSPCATSVIPPSATPSAVGRCCRTHRPNPSEACCAAAACLPGSGCSMVPECAATAGGAASPPSCCSCGAVAASGAAGDAAVVMCLVSAVADVVAEPAAAAVAVTAASALLASFSSLPLPPMRLVLGASRGASQAAQARRISLPLCKDPSFRVRSASVSERHCLR